MKIFIASLLLSAVAASASSASSRIHLRVHSKQAGSYQSCTEETGCQEGLECVRQSPEYAQCMPPLKLGELCGRYVADRPEEESQNWEAACEDGLLCALSDGKDMRCVNEEDVEAFDSSEEGSYAFSEDASDNGEEELELFALWEQCAFEDYEGGCEDDNVCVIQSDYYGQCMPPQLEEGALCGQTGDEQNWEHVCEEGLECVQADGKDMRCKATPTAVARKGKNSHHKKQGHKAATTYNGHKKSHKKTHNKKAHHKTPQSHDNKKAHSKKTKAHHAKKPTPSSHKKHQH